MSTEVVVPAQVAGAERFQTGRVLTIAAGHGVHDTYTAFLAPLLPVFITSLSLSKTEAGLLTVFIRGPSLSQPFIGHLADRISLRYFVILAPAVAAVMMSLLGVAPSYAILALLLTVVGFGSAAFHAVAPVMAGRLSGRSLGRGMGFWMVGGELGRTLGPIIVVSAVKLLTLQGTPWLMIAGLLASVILYLRLRDVPGRPPNAGQGLPWRQALRGMRPLMIPLVGIITARSFMTSALTTYLPTFLSEEGSSLWFAGVSLSVLEAAGVVGALLGGSLSDWMGRRQVLFFSLLTTPLLMFVFLSVNGWTRFPILPALGFTSLSITPVIMALVQESFPQNRALANGVYMSMSFLIRSGAIVVLGALGDLFGMRLAFAASAIITLLGSPLLLLLP
ncbi:MAG TPA: MFS transporter [Anaerolineae bacterium]|nr:MFS transporter [Anaerolineae bacterium]HIQ06135.1 MFS transporter [Anaerolineae bacterium]